MPNYTPNLNLEKPLGSENYAISVYGGNADILDSEIGNLKDNLLDDDYSAITTTQAIVDSMATGVLKSPMMMQIDGEVLDNETVNGDVATSLTSDDSTTYIDINPDGTWEFFNAYTATNQTFNLTSGDKVFVYTKLKSDSVGRIKTHRIVHSGGTGVTGTTVNGALELSDILTATLTGLHNFKTMESTSGLIERDYQIFINMTSLGIESYSESKMLELVRSGYFEGISFTQPDLESVGKNVFDYTKAVDGSYWSSTNTLVAQADSWYSEEYIPVKEGQIYIGNHPSSSMQVMEFDSSNNFIQRVNKSSGVAYTVPSGVLYVRLSWYNQPILIKETAQFELGSTSTTYQPHYTNTLQPNITLRRVPNDTRDSLVNADISPDDVTKYIPLNRWEYRKRIMEYELESGDFASLITSTTNVDLVTLFNSVISDINDFGISDLIATKMTTSKTIPLNGEAVDDSGSIWRHYFNPANWVFIVPKGAYADITAVRADLAGTKIYYQLAEPIITTLSLPELYSFQYGSLYQNNIPSEIEYTAVKNYRATIDAHITALERLDDEAYRKGQSITFEEEQDDNSEIDWRYTNKAFIELTANTTLTFVNPKAPTSLLLRIKQDSTGSWTLTLPTILWSGGVAPTLTTTADSIDIIGLYYDGTNYYGQTGLNFG